MDRLDIKFIIEDYLEKVDNAISAARPADGLFGFSKGPKDDPCHQKFYDDIEKAVSQIKSSDEAYAVADELLRAESSYSCPQMASLMLTAVQGHVINLVPLLNAEQKNSLRIYFDESIPRWKRLPVQKKLYQLLKEQ